MTDWKKPKDELPPQGLKILCMHKGDFYVAQRWANYWFSIPFYDSQFSRYFEPEMWSYFNFPNDLTGKIHVQLNGKMYDIDDLEKNAPEIYRQMLSGQLELFNNPKRKT